MAKRNLVLFSFLALAACKDDNLSAERLLESASYGLAYVDIDEGVFTGTDIGFSDFLGAECPEIIAELRASPSANLSVFSFLSFHSGSGTTLTEARADTLVRDDCTQKHMEVWGVGTNETRSGEICQSWEKSTEFRILDRDEEGLALRLRYPTGTELSLDYGDLESGLVSGRTYPTRQQRQDFGWDEYWDENFIVCTSTQRFY